MKEFKTSKGNFIFVSEDSLVMGGMYAMFGSVRKISDDKWSRVVDVEEGETIREAVNKLLNKFDVDGTYILIRKL